MTLASSGRASYRWLTITLLVAAGVYAWYASAQYGRLNDLNQRQLSNAGAELKAALDTAVETATRFNAKRAAWQDSRTSKSTRSKPGGDEPKLCDFDDNQPYLELDACARGVSPVPNRTTWRSLTVVQPFTSPMLGIKVTDANKQGGFDYRFRADKVLRELAFPDSFALIVVSTDGG